MFWFLPLIMGTAAAMAGAANRRLAVDEETAARVRAANDGSAQAERAARLQESRAREAYGRGEAERLRRMRDFQREQGARAAALAASGVDVNSGSALDVLADGAAEAALDAGTVRRDASREAAGHRDRAAASRERAARERDAARHALTAGEREKQAVMLDAVGSIGSRWTGKMAQNGPRGNFRVIPKEIYR